MFEKQPLRIFLAEDNPADVFLVEMALKEQDIHYCLRRAADGEEALRLVSQFGQEEPVPDVALLDLNLPRFEGYSVIRSIREHSCCVSTPIIVMSSSFKHSDRATADQFDAVFFSKPSDLARFLELGELVKSLTEHIS